MNISAGKAKSKLLQYPSDRSFRPTKQIVKAAIFDIIFSHAADNKKSFLDLFCGSGNIGLEAWSRGFQEVVMVDQEIHYATLNLATIKKLREYDQNIELYRNNALIAIEILFKKQRKFEIIFIDPPYDSTLVQDSLNKLEPFDILEPDGLVLIETSKGKTFTTNSLKLIKEYNYGVSYLQLFKKGIS